LLSYKKDFSPKTKIVLNSSGFGTKVKNILYKIPKGIIIWSSQKESPLQKKFQSFNVAPIDIPKYKSINYSNGCRTTQSCGISLNRYGYYPCGAGGGIDRVFGFNIGKKKVT